MKFEFSLESVLKVRKHEEKVEKQKLAEKLNKKKHLNALKEKLKKELENHISENGSSTYASLHDLQRKQQYINDLYEKVKKVNSSLNSVKKAVDQQRDKLADVHKKRHIMEKVKEGEQELYFEEMSRQQRKVMDEVAAQTFSK
ncbi:flagellar export protein FliJ [Aliifodinibius salipaludis]|uniref:Flagellar FliJ protein n=1 Tax=Fodinibius salipaludis TaxID=2032627 RepID=A0A2A2GCK1_9BACT|nr:flagellar export protein FliJ [Aliifodinibius salipaludis]PAU94623.1 flagellar export protein FliJ [Aliifodinibius salipaludis]